MGLDRSHGMVVRIRTDGMVHRALKRLDLLGGHARAVQIRGCDVHLKDLQRLCEFGLVDHVLRGPYDLTERGKEVLDYLESIQVAHTTVHFLYDRKDHPWRQEHSTDEDFIYHGWDRKGYKNPKVWVPGNAKWQEYFQEVKW